MEFFICCKYSYNIDMKYDAIVLAGGKGTRLNLGYNKVFYKLDNGLSIFENACMPFINDEACQRIIVVVSDEDKSNITTNPKMTFVNNGKERFNSVLNGLRAVTSEYVMIHDGARPYITDEDIDNIKKTLLTEDACMLARASKDTVKRVIDGYVVNTINRKEVYLAQTPQCFKTDIIKEAYFKGELSGETFTDDASVLEWYKPEIRIKIVESVTNNNKITFIDDIK